MIEVRREGCRDVTFNRGSCNWEAGAKEVIYLPACALVREGDTTFAIKGDYLGGYFTDGHSYRFLKTHVRIVPELPLNQVIGIPSKEGKIFGDDDA